MPHGDYVGGGTSLSQAARATTSKHGQARASASCTARAGVAHLGVLLSCAPKNGMHIWNTLEFTAPGSVRIRRSTRSLISASAEHHTAVLSGRILNPKPSPKPPKQQRGHTRVFRGREQRGNVLHCCRPLKILGRCVALRSIGVGDLVVV